jgi:hypothetical protein
MKRAPAILMLTGAELCVQPIRTLRYVRGRTGYPETIPQIQWPAFRLGGNRESDYVAAVFPPSLAPAANGGASFVSQVKPWTLSSHASAIFSSCCPTLSHSPSCTRVGRCAGSIAGVPLRLRLPRSFTGRLPGGREGETSRAKILLIRPPQLAASPSRASAPPPASTVPFGAKGVSTVPLSAQCSENPTIAPR